MESKSLEARVQQLEDIEAIKKLKAVCSHLVDIQDGEGFADLFTEDGEFIGAVQQHKGRDSLAKVKFWPFMVHFVTNPIIEVDGLEATGQWYFLRPYTAPDGKAYWAAGRYEDAYVKVEGRWKFRSIRITNFFASPYDKGWAEETAA